MKILMATPLYPPEIGGPATYTKELAERLRDSHEIKILAYTARNPEHIDGVKLIFVDKLKFLPYRLFRFFMAAYNSSKGMDVIYVQNAVAAGLPAVLAGKLRGIPVVLKMVGDESWERAHAAGKTTKLLVPYLQSPDGGAKSWVFRKIQKFVLKRVNVLTTPSKYLGEEILKSYKLKTKFVTNYNAVTEAKDIPIETTKKPGQIMTTARLVTWKGIDGIIEAVSILKDKIQNINLVIAGDGPEMENLKSNAKSTIEILGFQKDEVLRNVQLQKKLTDGASKLLDEKFSWKSHINTLETILESVSSKPNN